MKIIHTADIHLGSKMTGKLDIIKSEERKRELKETFEKLAKYADKNNIPIIILAGDIFDTIKPDYSSKSYFYGVINAYPNIDFLYLRGNHDCDNKTNLKLPNNLKMFKEDEWTYYYYGDNKQICITGIEISKKNPLNTKNLNLDKNKFNIAILHGNLSNEEPSIDLTLLKNKNIDYLALGHIHKNEVKKLDQRGIYAYSGCLEPRGFDETKEKGFYLLDIKNNAFKHEFIPFSKRIIDIIKIDVSNMKSAIEISNHIKKLNLNKDNLYRFILNGKINYDIEEIIPDIEILIKDSFYFFDIKLETTEEKNYIKYKNDNTLKGQFIRNVLSNNKYSDKDKTYILNKGLSILEGDSK